MVNYQQGKVYCIRINHEGKEHVYVGSTTKKRLCDRRTGHVADSKRTDINSLLYNLINSLPSKWFGIKLQLLESFPCESKDQLHAKEAEWVRKIGTLNERIPGHSREQWFDEHREYLAEKAKLYYKNNKEAISVPTPCPYCNRVMRHDSMRRHIKNMHPDA